MERNRKSRNVPSLITTLFSQEDDEVTDPSVAKEAEHIRVQELVKRIENHPHREAFHADLQQNNVYNPFSNNSKAMIRELGNVELFELCETIPKVHCSHCLLYWN